MRFIHVWYIKENYSTYQNEYLLQLILLETENCKEEFESTYKSFYKSIKFKRKKVYSCMLTADYFIRLLIIVSQKMSLLGATIIMLLRNIKNINKTYLKSL